MRLRHFALSNVRWESIQEAKEKGSARRITIVTISKSRMVTQLEMLSASLSRDYRSVYDRMVDGFHVAIC